MKEMITEIVVATEEDIKSLESTDFITFSDLVSEDVVELDLTEGNCEYPDTEGEVDENAITPLCGGTGLSGAMLLGVNKSGSTINVRSGASTSHTVLAKIYDLECYTYTGSTKSDGSYTWYQIECLNSSGKWIAGWYRGFNGMAYWKNNYNSSLTSEDRLGGNFYCRTYTVYKEVKVWKGDKSAYARIPSGATILCRDGYQGKTGSSEHSWMLCHGVRYYFDGWHKDELFQNIGGFGSAGYADTQIKSTPRQPALKGNWW